MSHGNSEVESQRHPRFGKFACTNCGSIQCGCSLERKVDALNAKLNVILWALERLTPKHLNNSDQQDQRGP